MNSSAPRKGLEVSSRSSGRRYMLEEQLGKGSYGEVWLAVDPNAKAKETSCVAIKFIDVRKQGEKLLLREAVNQRLHGCPNVVKLHEELRFKGYVCLVMEYMPGGTLRDYVNKKGALAEGAARWFFQQAIYSVKHVHAKEIVLRDIKLGNMLLDAQHALLKLCDFGASKGDQAPCTFTGTPAYLAPELVRAVRANKSRSTQIAPYDGQPVDVWCCGVCLFIMVYGKYPFIAASGSTRELLDAIVTCNPEIPDFVNVNGHQRRVSSEVRDLMARIFVSDPNQRITMQEIIEHSWFLKDLPDGTLDQLKKLEEPSNGKAAIRMRKLSTFHEMKQKLFPGR